MGLLSRDMVMIMIMINTLILIDIQVDSSAARVPNVFLSPELGEGKESCGFESESAIFLRMADASPALGSFRIKERYTSC